MIGLTDKIKTNNFTYKLWSPYHNWKGMKVFKKCWWKKQKKLYIKHFFFNFILYYFVKYTFLYATCDGRNTESWKNTVKFLKLLKLYIKRNFKKVATLNYTPHYARCKFSATGKMRLTRKYARQLINFARRCNFVLYCCQWRFNFANFIVYDDAIFLFEWTK